MTALPSSVSLGLMMISKSIPSSSITRFKAIQSQSGKVVRILNDGETRTLEVDPEIVRVEDLEFADYTEGGSQKVKCARWGDCGDVLDLNSSVCSDGTWAISSKRI